ncbi:MAG: proteasome subunit alpha [Candidatus Bipolaricaulia bacterium]
MGSRFRLDGGAVSESEFETTGDFLGLLRRSGIPFPEVGNEGVESGGGPAQGLGAAHGTTVIAVKFRDGVLNVADRRATSSNYILYDEAEKILSLDDQMLIAIAGSYAQAIEAVRFLRHNFKYYARSQLQEMSLEGKLGEVSRVLGRSLPGALQGIGGFLPVVSAHDRQNGGGRIFFYDMLGARFESREFGAAGSGAERIRGVFDYIVRSKGPFHTLSLDEVLRETLLLLDIAAGLDAATAGLGGVPPLAKTVTADGIADIPEDHIRALQKELVQR